MSGVVGLFVVLAALGMSAGLILLLGPVFGRYARAYSNARGSRAKSIPLGAGMAVICATIGMALLATLVVPSLGAQTAARLGPIFGATALMALVGVLADLDEARVGLRLSLQTLIIAGVVLLLPDDLRVLPLLPFWLERALVVVAGLWFLNLVNFMDGMDLMTVSEVAPITAGLALISCLDSMPVQSTLVALALLGAILGFAPFNRRGDRLFLGDVGSLPIGLLLGWLLLLLAGGGHLAAAVLLPLYYLADATTTLLVRIVRGARVWERHQVHFYQLAAARGFSNIEVVSSVFVLNLALAALAVVTVLTSSIVVDMTALAVGGGLVAWLFTRFAGGKE